MPRRRPHKVSVDKPTGFAKRKLKRWVRRIEKNNAQMRLFDNQQTQDHGYTAYTQA
jgi:hypothetical protein